MLYKKIFTLIIVLILVFSTASGCDYEDDFALYFELNEEPGTLDPQLASSPAEEIIVRNIFEGLCRLDENGRVVEGAAKTPEISSDGLIYTFKIKDSAKWQDGSPVTAGDFVLAFKRALEPKTKAPKATLLYCIKNAEAINTGKNGELGVKAIDSKTLEIILTEKKSDFLELLTSSVAMPCNSSVFSAAKGKYGLNAEDISCNGSFYLRKWEKSEGFSLKINKNDAYEGDFIANASAVIFSQGEIEGRADKIADGNLDFGFTNLSEAKTELSGFTFNRTSYALIINKNSTIGNINFRKAFIKSINRERLEGELSSVFELSSSLLPEVLTLNGSLLESKISKIVTDYSPGEAHTLYLKGIKDSGLPKSVNMIYCGGKDVARLSRLVAEDFQTSLGAVINIKEAEDTHQLNNALLAGEYELAMVPITTSDSDPISFLSKFTSGSPENHYGFKSSNYDKLITSLSDSTPEDKFISTVDAALKVTADDNSVIPIADYKEAFSYSKGYICPIVSPFNGVIDLALVNIKK